MANLTGVSSNRIVDEAARSLSTTRRIAGAFGALAALTAATLLSPISGLFVLVGTGIVCLCMRPNSTLMAGASGELLVLKELQGLPDTYHVFNQLDVPNAKSRTGVNEADLIVAGPNGIFVIEVKHNNGRVQGNAKEREWIVEKTGRAGGTYAKVMRNPIAQVKQLVWLLSKQLETRGKRRPWIQGIVVFSNDAANFDITDDDGIPCLRLGDLRDYLLRFSNKGESGEQALPVLLAMKTQAA